MRRTNLTDEFYNNQPPLLFVEALKKPFFEKKPDTFGKHIANKKETNVEGIYIINNFDDPKGLLKSVTDDFLQFSTVYEIIGKRYPLVLEYRQTNIFEAYSIEVSPQQTTIYAGDTEGIRRGIIHIEDMIIACECPALPLGNISRKPWLESRVTRGFFSPTNRPPKNIDELENDIDYYPENYLVRIMHDGTNGLWIYTRFKELLTSPTISEFGKEYKKRIDKLNKIINKCALYGIKVYIFSIEPAALDESLYEKYHFLMGNKLDNQYCLCPFQEKSKKYLFDSGKILATLCPDLGGVICLTAGERLSSCASIIPNTCAVCKDIPRGKILGKAVELLAKGLRETNPKIELISWTYGHREWALSDIDDYVKTSPSDAYLMQNFEDNGYNCQLLKKRKAIDYWLSYVGPSKMFKFTNNSAKKYGKKMWAKMQICCSHELASLPYIPSPQHVYEKLKKAKQGGIKGIVECWYFGNYPSIMSKAVGMLAFEEKFSKSQDFLTKLASYTYGKSNANAIKKSWQLFYKGYNNSPTNIMFSYYGPMHDGVVWELALKPKNFSLPRTWQLPDKRDGDRIQECLMYGHTLAEAIILTKRIRKNYRLADKVLMTIKNESERIEDIKSVSKALLVLSESTVNILNFYSLREKLGRQKKNPLIILKNMERIVKSEINNSKQIKQLSLKDSRLGYHSEAEGYKFFPLNLDKRIEQLKSLVETEFVEVESRIKEGKTALEYYNGVEEGSKSYTLKKTTIENAKWEHLSDGKSRFRMTESNKAIILDIESQDEETRYSVMPEFDLLKPTPSIYVYSMDGRVKMPEANNILNDCKLNRERKKWKIQFLNKDRTKIRFIMGKKAFNIKRRPFKLSLSTYNNPWIIDSATCKTLLKDHVSPGEYGWIFFEE